MFFAQPATPPVSYSREVAPILALHCNSCHGSASGLSTRSYRDLMNGGNLGKAIVPGDPERSPLIHFIDGRRGEEHRMPLGARPLTTEQITTIRRWIAEGAAEDPDTTEKYRFTAPEVRLDRSKVLRVFARLPMEGYLILTVSDARKKRTLRTEVAAIKAAKDRSDAGAPGELISWTLRPERDWPRLLTLELTVAYAQRHPLGTEFFARVE